MRRVAALALTVVLSSCTSTAATHPASGPQATATGGRSATATGPAASAKASASVTGQATPGATGTGSAATSSAASVAHPVVASVGTFPYPLSRMAATTDGSRVILLGGLRNGASSADVFAFDPVTHRVRRLGALEKPVHDTAAGTAGGTVMLVGGGAATEAADVQALQVSGGTRRVGTLPQPRSDLSVVTVGSTLYVVGGYTGAADTPDILATTDGVHFRVVGRLKVTVRYAAVVAVGTDIWVIGGDHQFAPTAVVQRIDTLTGRVTLVGRLAHPLGHASAWLTPAGTVLVAGGTLTNSTRTDAISRFDPRTLALTRVARLPRPTSDMGVAVVGGVAYLFGGETPARIGGIVSVS
ncbi:MAG: hypothetical protein QOF57_556 [Frankiaceae bacterium]|nr:hypothetical protein [Frankiaceae bacterium]